MTVKCRCWPGRVCCWCYSLLGPREQADWRRRLGIKKTLPKATSKKTTTREKASRFETGRMNPWTNERGAATNPWTGTREIYVGEDGRAVRHR